MFFDFSESASSQNAKTNERTNERKKRLTSNETVEFDPTENEEKKHVVSALNSSILDENHS